MIPRGFAPVVFLLVLSGTAMAQTPWRNPDLETAPSAETAAPHVERIRVYLRIDGPDDFAGAVREAYAYAAPETVVVVRYRAAADVVIKLVERAYEVTFYKRHQRPRKKKYKKRYRRAADRCQNLYKAYYDEITERAVARFDYRVKIRAYGWGSARDRIRDTVYQDFRYAVNLRSQTGCGVKPSEVFPSKKVRRLFENNTPDQRREIREILRSQTARTLAHTLARYDLPSPSGS